MKRRIGGKSPLSVTGYVEAPLAYDAVWALALALNKTQARWDTEMIEMVYLTGPIQGNIYSGGVITSAVTSRRLIVTSYNMAIIRFWYPATNNRDSVFTVSKHHVFMKIPVLETPSFLHLPLLSCMFVCLCANRGRLSSFDAFVPVFGEIQQFAPQQLIGLVCVVSLAIPLCHWSRLFVTVLKLTHDYSVSISLLVTALVITDPPERPACSSECKLFDGSYCSGMGVP